MPPSQLPTTSRDQITRRSLFPSRTEVADGTRDRYVDKPLRRHFWQTETDINRHDFGYRRLAQSNAVLRQSDSDITFRQHTGNRA